MPKEKEMTFFDHLEALRPHLMRGISALFIVTVVAFFGRVLLIDHILLGPQSADFPTNRFLCLLAEKFGIPDLCLNQNGIHLINTRMAGQFHLHIMVSFAAGFILSIPYLLWELWRFIKPALTPFEQKKSRMFVGYVSGCFLTGLLFGYYVISPLAVNFFSNYTASAQIGNFIDVSSYLSSVLNVSIASAIVFELPVLVYFLARMRILGSALMIKYRRHMIVVLAVFSAVITPPDPVSLVLLLLPLYGLYELSIRIAKKVEKSYAATE